MADKTSTASDLPLGKMEGLRSYEPQRGWEDLKPEQQGKSENQASDDDFFEDAYEPPAEQESGSKKIQEVEEDFIEQDLADLSENNSINSLARKVAKTNLLVDSALGNEAGDDKEQDSNAIKQLDQLGASLSELFSDLYKESAKSTKSPWENVSEAFDELSSEVQKREDLRGQLSLTQKRIDSCRKELIKTIERLAHEEQERLTVVRMRSRLATVMADKLLKKLK